MPKTDHGETDSGSGGTSDPDETSQIELDKLKRSSESPESPSSGDDTTTDPTTT